MLTCYRTKRYRPTLYKATFNLIIMMLLLKQSWTYFSVYLGHYHHAVLLIIPLQLTWKLKLDKATT